MSAWLAGLLEGEGSFTHNGGCPRVSLRMTDKDILERFAKELGVEYQEEAPPKSHWNMIFRCNIYGDRAAVLMERILPWMGERRSAKIRECLAARVASQARLAAERTAREAKLPASELTAHWSARAAGETLSTFAREYGVHPEIMKRRLVELGIYNSPAYKCRTDVTYTCAVCTGIFVRKASQKGVKYCSRICSGRAAQQRRWNPVA